MQAWGSHTIRCMLPHKSNDITPTHPHHTSRIPGKSHGNYPEKLKPYLCAFLSRKASGKGLTDVPVMHGLPLHCWPLAVYDSCMEGILYFKGFTAANSISMCLHACYTTASCGSIHALLSSYPYQPATTCSVCDTPRKLTTVTGTERMLCCLVTF